MHLDTIIDRPTDFRSNKPIINKLYRLGLGRSILIRGRSGSGMTAFLFEIAKDYMDQGCLVLFFDQNGALRPDRITDLPPDQLIAIHPTSLKDIFRTIETIAESKLVDMNKLLICLDGSYNLSENADWYVKYKPEAIRDNILRNFKGASIAITEKIGRKVPGPGWFEVIYLSDINKSTSKFGGTLVGHTVKVLSKDCSELIFIDYKVGRISSAWLVGLDMIKNQGVSPSSTFGKVKGIWNYVKSNIGRIGLPSGEAEIGKENPSSNTVDSSYGSN